MKSVRKLLKGKWKFNLKEDKIICQNNYMTYCFEKKDDMFFQNIITIIGSRNTPDPELEFEPEEQCIPISLETFHRIMRANEVLYVQEALLRETPGGLVCSSEYIPNFLLNHNKYDSRKCVKVDPNRICKITRVIRTRERVIAKINLSSSHILLDCEFPWVRMTVKIKTI